MKIVVAGCAGRMGKEILAKLFARTDCEVIGGTEYHESPFIGHDLGELIGAKPKGVKVSANLAELLKSADVLIDFSAASAAAKNVAEAAAAGCAIVIGTTGLGADAEKAINEAAQKIAIVKAPNMSLGVNLLTALVEKAAKALDEAFDIEIMELHHNQKKDSPSGTALLLGEAAAKGRGSNLSSLRAPDIREGVREAGQIGFAVVRGGNIVGEHTVLFAGENERIEIRHQATSRTVFVSGAIKAAFWLKGKKAGLYSMLDVLGLN